MITTLSDIHKIFEMGLYMEHYHLIDIPLAIYISKCLPGDPIWATPVTPSGMGKTIACRPYIDLAYDYTLPTTDTNNPMYGIVYISQVTPASFASGQASSKNTDDIGHWLNGRNTMIIISDLASIQTMDEAGKEKLQGIFRELFDGRVKIDTGTKKKHYGDIHTTMISFCTPEVAFIVDEANTLGTRGITYRVPQIKDREKAMNKKDTKKCRRARTAIIKKFIDENMNPEIPKLSEEQNTMVKKLAILISKWRTVGICNSHYELIQVVNEEYPMRVRLQLEKLLRCLLFIGVEKEQAEQYITDIATSTGNKLRWDIMEKLILHGINRGGIDCNDLSNFFAISPYEIRKQLWILKQQKLAVYLPASDNKEAKITDFNTQWIATVTGDNVTDWR